MGKRTSPRSYHLDCTNCTKECIADFLDQMLSNTIDPKETLVKELRCTTYHNNFCLQKYNCMCFFVVFTSIWKQYFSEDSVNCFMMCAGKIMMLCSFYTGNEKNLSSQKSDCHAPPCGVNKESIAFSSTLCQGRVASVHTTSKWGWRYDGLRHP